MSKFFHDAFENEINVGYYISTRRECKLRDRTFSVIGCLDDGRALLVQTLYGEVKVYTNEITKHWVPAKREVLIARAKYSQDKDLSSFLGVQKKKGLSR